MASAGWRGPAPAPGPEEARRGVLVAVVEAGWRSPDTSRRAPTRRTHRDRERRANRRASMLAVIEPVARWRREAIQRSSTRSPASRRRLSFGGDRVEQDQPGGVPHLVGESRPCWTRACEKRTSWAEDIANRPKRRASAPCSAISSRGSIPVPRLFDIRRPSGAWITECTYTSLKGPAGELERGHDHPCDPEKDDVLAVTSTSVGKNARYSGASVSGQPRVAKGQSAELNRCRVRRIPAPSRRPRRLLADVDLGFLVGVAAVPDRQSVPPPELPRWPRADPLEPLRVDPGMWLGRDEPHSPVPDDLDRRLRHLIHPAEPPQRDQRLDPLPERWENGTVWV